MVQAMECNIVLHVGEKFTGGGCNCSCFPTPKFLWLWPSVLKFVM